jgi:hypothetical protein
MAKNKELGKFLAGKNTPKHEPKTLKVVEESPGKMGRPSDKRKGVHYVKLSAMVPFELRENLKLAMLTTHKHLGHKTQDSFIEAALEYYIKSKSKPGK